MLGSEHEFWKFKAQIISTEIESYIRIGRGRGNVARTEPLFLVGALFETKVRVLIEIHSLYNPTWASN